MPRWPRFRGVPFLHDYDPSGWDGLTGFVVEHNGWYWNGGPTGSPEGWTRNPRRALVENVSPWLTEGRLLVTQGRGRCVEVLLEGEVTMLPLRHWPRRDLDVGAREGAAVDARDERPPWLLPQVRCDLQAVARMPAQLDVDLEDRPHHSRPQADASASCSST